MTVVALGVLGVYSFVSPETQGGRGLSAGDRELRRRRARRDRPAAGAAQRARSRCARSRPPRCGRRSPCSTPPRPTGWPPRSPTAFGAAGWETPGVGGYTGNDVAASTVFFTEGDETQRQAAVQLVDAFPQLQGPAPRFFELPADVTAPGLVVVLTGDWTP